MAEMEKEGRPPENKRSRKPAHPVKREINEEMKVKGGSVPSCMWLRVVVRSMHVCWSTNQAYIYNTLKCKWLHDSQTLINDFFLFLNLPKFHCPFPMNGSLSSALYSIPPCTMDAAPIHRYCSSSSLKFWISTESSAPCCRFMSLFRFCVPCLSWLTQS